MCHSVFDFRLQPLFAFENMSKFKDGRVYLKNSWIKVLILKHCDGLLIYAESSKLCSLFVTFFGLNILYFKITMIIQTNMTCT